MPRPPASLRGALGATAVVLALAGAFAVFRLQRAGWRPGGGEAPVADDGWARLFFTEPAAAPIARRSGGPDTALAAAIDAARQTVDVAVYHLNLESICQALMRARQRGVRVRVVTESDNLLEPEIEALQAAGIPVLGDRRESLMHHKFTLIDGREVWTGSMNYTLDGAYGDNNNLLALRSPELAADYTREFEEMFLDDRFGPLSLPDTPYRVVSVDGRTVEAAFSPDDGVAARLLALLNGAQGHVELMAYAFTSDPLAEALQQAARRGVEVRLLVESDLAEGAGSEYGRLRQAGLDVRRDSNPKAMHHKVIIIDRAIVVTGSYNFTRSAEEANDENVLILHDPALAELYRREFERLFAAGL